MSKILTTEKSGLTRAYFTPQDWQMPLPSIQEIISNPSQYNDLMQHIALNHKGLNWKFFRYQLDKNTYPIFIYSLALCAQQLKPTWSYSWQFQKNANKLYRFLEKNNIVLDINEQFLLETCKNFTDWAEYEINRQKFLRNIIDALNNYYANFS